MKQELQSFNQNQHRTYLIKLLIILAVLISLWGGADIFSALFVKDVFSATTDTEYIPDLGNILKRGTQTKSFTINSYGLRNDELLPIIPHEKRILVIGDSVAFGTKLYQGNDWPTQLQNYLRKQGVAVTVMNGGQSGTTYEYSFKALKHYNNLLKIDLVIIQATGNLYTLFKQSYKPGMDVSQIGSNLFPNYKKHNLSSRVECDTFPKASTRNGEILNIPTLLKRLSYSSPSANFLTNHLNDVFKTTPKADIIPTNDQCYVYGGNFMETEMLSVGRLLQYAKDNNLPIVIVKPSYAFNWKHKPTGDTLKSLNFKIQDSSEFKQINLTISQFFSFFEKNSDAIFIDPITYYESHHQSFKNDADIKKLYLDYAHFSAEGAKLIGQTIAEELITKHRMSRSTQTEWQYPQSFLPTPLDLQYKEIPSSLNKKEIIYSAIITYILFLTVGTALKIILFRSQPKYNFLLPILGGFILLTGGLFVTEFQFNPNHYFIGLIVFSSLIVFYYLLINKISFKKIAFSILLISSIATIFSLYVCHALHSKPSKLCSNIKTEIAFAEYFTTPKSKRSNPNQIYNNEIKDGKIRPDYIPDVLGKNETKIYPAAPNLAMFELPFTKISIQNIVLGVHVASLIILLTAVMGILKILIKKRTLFVFSTTLIVIIFSIFADKLIPTEFLLLIISAGTFIGVTLTYDFKNQYVKYLFLIVGSSVLYMLPAKSFIEVIALLTMIIFLQAYFTLGKIKKSLFICIISIICLLSSRALLFNRTIADPTFYTLLADLHMPPFLMKNGSTLTCIGKR